MMIAISEHDLGAANELIEDLYREVTHWETSLSGGAKLRIGTEAIEGLRTTSVTFGNPYDNLVRLTRESFQLSGVELTPARQKQLDHTHKFYLLTLAVNLRSRPSMQFKNLRCLLDFGPKGSEEPIVQTIFPTDKWQSVFSWGGGLVLGLDGSLDWRIGLPVENLTEHLQGLPANVAGHVANANHLKALIAVPDYSFNSGRLEVAAYGDGGSECYWSIQEPKLRETSMVRFIVVFKVPLSVQEITLKGTVWAEPKMEWLASNLRDVLADLKPSLQQLFRQEEGVPNELTRGSIERWTLRLPAD